MKALSLYTHHNYVATVKELRSVLAIFYCLVKWRPPKQKVAMTVQCITIEISSHLILTNILQLFSHVYQNLASQVQYNWAWIWIKMLFFHCSGNKILIDCKNILFWICCFPLNLLPGWKKLLYTIFSELGALIIFNYQTIT